MIISKIDQKDTDYLRGIAILVIMLHNFFHILQNAPGENEFSFSNQNVSNLLHNLASTPQDFVKQLFSFFGHYAVQLFVFLSGYGLSIKYGGATSIKYGNFIRNRLSKLFPVLFWAILFLFMYKVFVDAFIPSKQIDLSAFAQDALIKLTLLANLIPGKALSISSPWWFFSLILQLYLLAPLLLRLKKSNLIIAIAISWIIQLLILYLAPQHIDYLRLNFVGHLPEFCLGIYLARQNKLRIGPALTVSAIFIFMAGSFNASLWLVSFFVVPVLILKAYKAFAPETNSKLSQLIRFFGYNSLYLFAVHGLCRAPFVALGNQSVWGSWAAAILYLLVVTTLTLVFKYLVERISEVLLPQKTTT